MRTGILIRVATALGAGLAAAGPAHADEPLGRMLALLSPDVNVSGYVFSYLRQQNTLAADFEARAIVTDLSDGLREALVKPDETKRLTGLHLGAADAVLQSGTPAEGTVFVSGSQGFASGSEAALLARGFKRQASGTGVCAANDPNDLDEVLPEIPLGDPFGPGLYCVAVTEDVAIIARDKAQMSGALARLQGKADCPVCGLFTAMASAARAARGGAGEIVSAMGFSVLAHASQEPTFIALAIEDPKGFDAARAEAEAEMAKPKDRNAMPHLLSMFSASRLAGNETAQLVLLYPDRATAEAAAPKIESRLVAFPDRADPGRPIPKPERGYMDGPTGTTIAVITLRFGEDSPRAGLREVSSWVSATFNRKFTVLDPLQ